MSGPLIFIQALFVLLISFVSAPVRAQDGLLRGTGDLGVVIERASGSLLIIDTTKREVVGRVEGMGDLSHASVVFSPDQRYAFVFGRDGGLSKVDMLTAKITRRILQAGNSIGGAISDDGTLVAVSNYEPGGIRVFETANLRLVTDIPATWSGGQSKTLGLVDAPGRRFIFSLWDAGQTWIADFSSGTTPAITKPIRPAIRRSKSPSLS